MRDDTPDSEFEDLSTRLEAERPVPAAAFRGELRRRLLREAEPRATRPQRLRLRIAAYATSGLVLFAVAIVGLAGVGPLAA